MLAVFKVKSYNWFNFFGFQLFIERFSEAYLLDVFFSHHHHCDFSLKFDPVICMVNPNFNMYLLPSSSMLSKETISYKLPLVYRFLCLQLNLDEWVTLEPENFIHYRG